ncbi:MAG: L,D-transpeptidase family protein [Eubacteriaceae bacterium]|nr:L,D-transpeptidase family protein [Eubacteriaceae bacterium]
MNSIRYTRMIVLLALICTLITVIPMTAYAEDQEEPLENIILTDENTEIVLANKEFTYTGKGITPKVTVKYINSQTDESTELTEGADFELRYPNNVNVGSKTIEIIGKGYYSGKLEAQYRIRPREIKYADVNYQLDNGYLKQYIKPLKSVKYNGKTLKKGEDYQVKYEDNWYPGTGKIIITGKGNFTGVTVKKFYIAKVKNFTVSERKTDALTLSWYRRNNVTGYKLYRYNGDTRTLIKTIKGASGTKYTVTDLKAARNYKFAIRTYRTVNGKTYYGPLTEISTYTRPSKVTVEKLTPLVCAFTAKWNKQKCTGYQMIVSTDSGFRNIVRDKTFNQDTTSARIYDLNRSRTYYVKIRTYWNRNGKTVYGSWSKYKSVKLGPLKNGWNTIDGEKYYYSKGYALKGQHTLNGNKYYFNNKGVLRGATKTMWDKIKDRTSSTGWLMTTDTTSNTTCIYTGYAGHWNLHKYYRCSTGRPSDPTPKGTFYIGSRGYSFSGEKFTCLYWTGFIGTEYLYHSIIYEKDDPDKVRDGRIGYNISHGCVRLATQNAKWVYDNIPSGTKVITY